MEVGKDWRVPIVLTVDLRSGAVGGVVWSVVLDIIPTLLVAVFSLLISNIPSGTGSRLRKSVSSRKNLNRSLKTGGGDSRYLSGSSEFPELTFHI